jgi:hypothetical protein
VVRTSAEEVDELRTEALELESITPTYPRRESYTEDSGASLASYIKRLSKTLEVPFLPEDKSVYVFGTRRVYIKREHG